MVLRRKRRSASDDFLGEVSLSVATINEKLANNESEIWLPLGVGKTTQEGVTGELCISLEKRSVDKNIQGVATTSSLDGNASDVGLTPTGDAVDATAPIVAQNAASVSVVSLNFVRPVSSSSQITFAIGRGSIHATRV